MPCRHFQKKTMSSNSRRIAKGSKLFSLLYLYTQERYSPLASHSVVYHPLNIEINDSDK